ncbi:MAG: hypothetical protein AMK70_07790 [Nitrospira bacterium SG8_35_1]|nr:MAG: hypothetical protein AMK70_07790 [Nitrospira bacterium SG8_35_1]
MRFVWHLKVRVLFLAFSSLFFLAGCGGSGGLLADGGIIGTGTIIGTVPGTTIKAYADNGDIFETISEINDTDRHPFVLPVDSGLGVYLVMIVNDGEENEIVVPIAFPDPQGQVFARIILEPDQQLDLGHIPLYLDCSEVPIEDDIDGDCILDKPFILNEAEGSKNPLRQMDADGDGDNDYDDPDHGYGKQNGLKFEDPQDLDDDRVPNKYDDDFSPGPQDADEDGIEDDEDVNPVNWNGQGKHPEGQAWRELHGEYAEDNLNSCTSCHGDDFLGTAASAQVGCFGYGCHAGTNFKDDGSPGNNQDEEDSGEDILSEWNGQGMHPLGHAWREKHGEYAEDNLNSCSTCHGSDFRGTTTSAQVGCYECHKGPDPEDY